MRHVRVIAYCSVLIKCSTSDTNKLARGENTIEDYVDDKINNPPSQYKTMYPNNKVVETTSGHIIEVDDTPNWERIRVYHKSGTFVEMHPNGDTVQYSSNSSYRIVTSGDNLRVKGNVTVFVDGNADMSVGGDVTLDITNSANVTVPTTNWTGDINLTGDINITGTSTASGDHVSAGISGKGHTHTDTPGLGAGTTSKPQ